MQKALVDGELQQLPRSWGEAQKDGWVGLHMNDETLEWTIRQAGMGTMQGHENGGPIANVIVIRRDLTVPKYMAPILQRGGIDAYKITDLMQMVEGVLHQRTRVHTPQQFQKIPEALIDQYNKKHEQGYWRRGGATITGCWRREITGRGGEVGNQPILTGTVYMIRYNPHA